MGRSPYTTAQAWQAYQSAIDLLEVIFVNEPMRIEPALHSHTSATGFRSTDWTDAYLATLASLAGLRVVSFDMSFAQFGDLLLLPLHAQ